MKEILGGNLEKPFKFYGINGKKTYEGPTHIDDKTQVWELSDEDVEKLSNISDEEWEQNGFLHNWWRYSPGSTLEGFVHRYNINHHYMWAYDGYSREKAINKGKDFWLNRKYTNLIEYLCEEVGASTERNVTAVAVDLADMNDISLGELFSKYN